MRLYGTIAILAALFTLYISSGSTFWLICFIVSLWLVAIHFLNHLELPRFLRKIVHWLHAMSFEFFIVIAAHLIIRPILRLFGKMTRAGRSDGIPILLVHGYLCDWTSWIYFRWQLAKHFGPIYEIDLGHVLGSIGDYAGEVSEMASFIKQETKRSDLILIGHSMGGLVACAYATQMAPHGKVKAVISIGSPLKGTIAAHIGLIGKSGHEMLPNSDTIRKVQQGIAHRPETHFYQVMSHTDELVIPATSAILGAYQHYIVDDIGHMALIFSKRVVNKVTEWIKIEERI